MKTKAEYHPRNFNLHSVSILLTLLYDGKCTDRMHITMYTVSRAVLLKRFLKKYKVLHVHDPVLEERHQTSCFKTFID
jgi:hypothetical protein